MRKFWMMLIAILMLAAMTVTISAQEDRWDGADDLPVKPLECGMGGEEAPDVEATEEAAEETAEMPEYDGGQPTDAPDLAGQDITLVDVPKLIGIGYFDATHLGMQQAAE